MITLRALDLPYSFFDESHTNFFGSRGAWLHYERSCGHKRERIADLLNWITAWKVAAKVMQGELILPRGMTLEQIGWTWVPAGMPWWKPSEEINGDVQSMQAGLNTPQRICRMRGTGDFYENVREIAKAKKYAEDLGLQLVFAPLPQIQLVDPNADNSN